MADPLLYMNQIKAIAYNVAWNSESYQNVKSEMIIAVLDQPDDTEIGKLLIIAKHKGIDFLRSRKFFYSYRNRIQHVNVDDLPEEEQPCTVLTEDDMIANARVSKLVATLEGDDKKVMLLYLEGYRLTDIGEITGVSRSAVSHRFHRIVRRLRKEHGGVEWQKR